MKYVIVFIRLLLLNYIQNVNKIMLNPTPFQAMLTGVIPIFIFLLYCYRGK